MGQVTTLLSAIGRGEPDALGALYAMLYPELRRLAHSRLRRSGDLTLLDTTSLVHESFLRFEKSGALGFGDRSQFMAYAARIMRSVVVDVVRSRQSDRHGGAAVHVELGDPSPRPQARSSTRSCASMNRWRNSQRSMLASSRWSRCAISPA